MSCLYWSVSTLKFWKLNVGVSKIIFISREFSPVASFLHFFVGGVTLYSKSVAIISSQPNRDDTSCVRKLYNQEYIILKKSQFYKLLSRYTFIVFFKL